MNEAQSSLLIDNLLADKEMEILKCSSFVWHLVTLMLMKWSEHHAMN